LNFKSAREVTGGEEYRVYLALDIDGLGENISLLDDGNPSDEYFTVPILGRAEGDFEPNRGYDSTAYIQYPNPSGQIYWGLADPREVTLPMERRNLHEENMILIEARYWFQL